MLILPPGHAKNVGSGRRFTTRERWIISSVLGVVAIIAVIVIVSITTAEHKTAGSCIDVKFPIVIGAQELYECGTKAKELCASVDQPRGLSGQAGRAVAAECRKVGLPVG